jgi:selenocysteine lyase/cysteine desulfurase
MTEGIIGGMALMAVPKESLARYIVAHDKKFDPRDEAFWKLVRNQFPLTRERIYFNNGTMGPSPYVVTEAVKMKADEVDRTGEYAGHEIARPKVAKFIGATEDEISLTHNTTEAINVIAQGLQLKAGDEVIMTNHEHVGNAMPWMARAKRDGIVLKFFSPAQTAAENLNRINDLITKKTRAIAMPHISCTIGQVFPGKEISKLGHDKGLWVMLDGAHTPGMTPLDVHDIGCDFFAACGHKWMLAAKGTGFLYVKKESLDAVIPIWAGGESTTGWDYEHGAKDWSKNAHKFDWATQNASIYVGLAAAVDFLTSLGMENVAARGRALASYLRAELTKINGVEVLTPEEEQSRASITGFRLKKMPFDKFQGWLMEKHKIRIRGVGESNLNSLRISTHIYNNFDEVDLLLKAIKEVA